ncbi:MAG: methyltransferase domain-containing protein [Desulfobacterales bacterium]|jgi:SAM-dependent methyltransferase
MNPIETNPFQEFFEEDKYVGLKNYSYNYLLRKMAVEKSLQTQNPGLILEVGIGISPMMTDTQRVIYLDLFYTALKILKRLNGKGEYVVADSICLPFKTGIFTQTITSEVFEHLADDRRAIHEIARVMKPSGRFIITFPHRKFYFAIDDRFVGHFRRYELPEMLDRLKNAGFKPVFIQKVLGPLEKITMCFFVFSYKMIQKIKPENETRIQNVKRVNVFSLIFKWVNRCYMILAWLDAKIMPRALSTVLLINSIRLDRTDNK